MAQDLIKNSVNANDSFTVPVVFFESVKRHADVRALYAPHAKPIVEISYAELGTLVRRFGAGLLALGLTQGDHVALFADNRPRWIIADLALLGAGMVTVPRGSDTSTSEFEFILEHARCKAAIFQDKKIYDRMSKSPKLSNLAAVILMDDSLESDMSESPPVFKFETVLGKGEAAVEKFDSALAQVKPEMLASIVYTSGTTGQPKGVMLSQGNLASQPRLVDIGTHAEAGDIQLTILPPWHAYERAAEYFGLSHGSTLAYSDTRHLKEDLLRLRPQLLPCVPRIWEAIYDAVQDKLRKGSERNRKVFHYFSGIGQRYVHNRRIASRRDVRKTPASIMEIMTARAKMTALYPAYRLGDAMVFSKVRQVTGGRLRAAVSGGGSLAAYLDDFFEMLGIEIMNGYGLTETSPVASVRRLNHNVRGSVGLPLAETTIKITDEAGQVVENGRQGEIWISGPQVMQGYFENPESTAKVLTPDKWFKTGDLGWFSASGDLIISGRAKDTIVLVSGENVEPEPIEDVCRQSPLIFQIVVVGQDQKYVGALVVPVFSSLAQELKMPVDSEPSAIAANPQATKILKDHILAVMKNDGRFKPSDQIMKLSIVEEPFSQENGMLTQTLKIKRNVVATEYADVISSMFSPN